MFAFRFKRADRLKLLFFDGTGVVLVTERLEAGAFRWPKPGDAALQLTLYADDGRVEMDSNAVERSIRPLALTRKNALFAGSDRGDQTWATIASLVETCKLNGVDPQGYLCDVITRIVGGHPQSRLDELLPWAYPTISELGAAA